MRRKTTAITLFALLSTMHLAAQQRDSVYFQLDAVPDASLYLPAPPDSSSLRFVNDWHQYIWGKSMRSTRRGVLARQDAEYSIAYTMRTFSESMGIDMSEKQTPELYRLLLFSIRTAEMATWKAKDHYMRKRPYMQFNEGTLVPNDEEELRTNGSYPSGHTNLGWAAALILAEVNPTRQDMILQRGFEYGQSRVIAGFHYQSDVDAGRLTASAAVARLHADAAFCRQMEKAKEEFALLTHRPATINRRSKHQTLKKETKYFLGIYDYPNGARFLPAPPDTMDMRFYGDWAMYCYGRSLRQTPRGQQALNDADWHAKTVVSNMADSCGYTFDINMTPQLLQLMDMVEYDLSRANKHAKYQLPRKRPYAQMHEPSLLPEQEATHTTLGSYPSSHAAIGWGIALIMSEIDPAHQDILLKRGFEYGQSRIIAGYHWQSDVEAGRLVAAATIARLHADTNFQQLLQKAKAEFHSTLKH